MRIVLFDHNQTAYDSVVKMLRSVGKSAVIHPTGTGKSYIAFRLCENNPDKTICWLSPSENIFNTQLNNLRKDTGGWVPSNILFFTYSKLMILKESSLSEIQPDYIVLDEFHRCGAEMWGGGVKRLIKAYPNIPILGLSATAIRYLDNQRDMADELFDGYVASEMSLGEAIVRGILKPPKYILSVYSYQEDYDNLAKRVKGAKTKATKDEAKLYLNALRRTLEKADGLDIIFDRHMIDRKGKYIVFCSNVEHLKSMLLKVPEWFGKIDEDPHVYTVFSEDASSEDAMRQFAQDNSNHLKLLYSIDMLNEGVHVDDISGVILLRPTVSPIIYKQQIGRALSASAKKTPIIFDVVNNIENLNSIGAIQKEIKETVRHYHELNMDDYIVNQSFNIIDEVGNAKTLFQELTDTLSTSWDTMYQFALEYYRENGNLHVPSKFTTKEGYQLGIWLHTQRKVYRGESAGILDEERIKKLNDIHMEWNYIRDFDWEDHFQEAKKYFEMNGHLKVPANYVSDTGFKLGSWISNIRNKRKAHKDSASVSPERIARLDSIGMIWDVLDSIWNDHITAAKRYYAEHGDLKPPKNYVDPQGIKLANWLQTMRSIYIGGTKNRRLSEKQIMELDEIDKSWRISYNDKWEVGYSHAKQYYEIFGDLKVFPTYVTSDGFKLGSWIDNQREKYRAGAIKQYRFDRLNEIEMIWKLPDPWEIRFEIAKKYYEEHGAIALMPGQYTEKGMAIGKWINEQKHIRKGKRKGQTLTDEQIKKLDSIGMCWGNQHDFVWQKNYEAAKQFYQNSGNLNVPKDYCSPITGSNIARWIEIQSNLAKKERISEERLELLLSIGFEVRRTRSSSKTKTNASVKKTQNDRSYFELD